MLLSLRGLGIDGKRSFRALLGLFLVRGVFLKNIPMLNHGQPATSVTIGLAATTPCAGSSSFALVLP
ncbi:hypothetical protein [Hymenobacter sp. PAMC 26628]|uniref:hypothetical protein n=1 Tax=Hymenobacter sp. PAMC 26628 TaxID=1484118 RepID=UPI000770153A|nr:hypothetical protein [Hymenobacter sp. PAMC 26628]AMJ66761.1 hypothetical protein AXW84_16010 [Hymenobacter sp. PAMC 26628]